jgi:hypothetical protein
MPHGYALYQPFGFKRENSGVRIRKTELNRWQNTFDCVAPLRGLWVFFVLVPHVHTWGYRTFARYEG